MRTITFRSGIILVSAAIIVACLVLSIPATAQSSEAEINYQRFLTIYRQDRPTRQELESALTFLQTSNLLAPNTYKYVFSLGALNNTLENWENAAEWLVKAKFIATTDDQRQLIQEELRYSQVQIAKLKVKNWGGPGMSISFIMKQGTLEMDQLTIKQLPQRLPVINIGASTRPLEDVLRHSLHDLRFDVLTRDPFLIVGLDALVSPNDHYKKGIKDFYRYFMNEYFDHPPRRLLVTVISSQPHVLVEATNRLYPEVGLPVYAPFLGYYNPADNLIMATGGRAGYGTLLHEMIHALIEADFPQAPAWLNEGLASLYERTRWSSGHLDALPNWRMDGMREEKISSLRELAQKAPELGLHSTEIREIRLLLLYLDQRKQVDDLYRLAKQKGSVFALEEAFVELGLNEDGWRAFLKNTFRDYHAEIAQNRGGLSNPDEVRFLQQALNQILGATLKIDGLWGSSTQEKLVEFQRRFGLAPDGILGPKTMIELKRYYTLFQIELLEKNP